MPDYIPQELMDKIMSYVYDFKTLRSCLKVSRSWRDATVPKLTLKYVIAEGGPWIEPLQESSNSLLQFVKRYHVESNNGPRFFTPNRYKFSHFYAFDNLRELKIDRLDLPSFMQELEKYFGRFAQSLQSLTLSSPKASCWQMISLIRIFKNLQDLKIYYFDSLEDVTTVDIPLAPPSTDALGGRLTLHFVQGKFMEEMIKLYGGRLNFRFVDLDNADYARDTLKACAGTLETLRVFEIAFYGPNSILRLHRDLFPSFKSLQTLVVNTPTPYSAYPFYHSLKTVVLASRLLNVVLVYRLPYFKFGCKAESPQNPDHIGWSTGIECARCDRDILVQFSKLWEIYKEREFRLVLCAEVLKPMVDRVIGILERNVEANKDGEFGVLLSQTSIISAIPSYFEVLDSRYLY